MQNLWWNGAKQEGKGGHKSTGEGRGGEGVRARKQHRQHRLRSIGVCVCVCVCVGGSRREQRTKLKKRGEPGNLVQHDDHRRESEAQDVRGRRGEEGARSGREKN